MHLHLYYDEESGKWTKTRKTADDGEHNPSCQYNNANTIASVVIMIIILIVDIYIYIYIYIYTYTMLKPYIKGIPRCIYEHICYGPI